MDALQIYTPDIEVYVRYRRLSYEEVEIFCEDNSEFDSSSEDFIRNVLRLCVPNLKTEVSPALKSISKEEAYKVLRRIYFGCIMLNPGLDVDQWLLITNSAYMPQDELDIITGSIDEALSKKESQQKDKKEEKASSKRRKKKPITKSKFLGLEEHLKSCVVGQDEAIEEVVKTLKRSVVGLSDRDRPIGTLLFAGSSGVGKAQPLDAKIATPEGFVAMGDMKPGCKIYNPDGSTQRVLMIHPQGVKPVYKVLFSDGASTEATEDHLWLVGSPENETVITTKEATKRLADRERLFVPLSSPVEFSDRHNSSLGSISSRWGIIQSLIDANAISIIDGNASFEAKGLSLARDVQEIVRSLGGVASIVESQGFAYQVLIAFPEDSHFFKLAYDSDLNSVSRIEGREIVSIDYVGDKECQCITVEHPNGLYVTDDFIVTHNTQLAKALHEYLFPDSRLVRVDFGEMQQKHDVQKLLGAPPSYIGYDDGGYLANQMSEDVPRVILLDEVEKAHPDIWNAFLRAFDEGELTDNSGKVLSFRDSIIVMTTNLGNRDIAASVEGSSVGFGAEFGLSTNLPSHSAVEGYAQKAIKKYFRPEMLNRIDKTVVFNQLSKDKLQQIARLELEKLSERLAKTGVSFSYSDSVLDFLVEEGFSPIEGARGIKKLCTNKIEDLIANELLLTRVSRGSVVSLSRENEDLVVNLKAPNKNRKGV